MAVDDQNEVRFLIPQGDVVVATNFVDLTIQLSSSHTTEILSFGDIRHMMVAYERTSACGIVGRRLM